jgi:hypothetical protein
MIERQGKDTAVLPAQQKAQATKIWAEVLKSKQTARQDVSQV